MTILIESLEFDCIIGLLKKERVETQKVILDVAIGLKEKKMVVDYAKVALLLEKTYKKKKFFTLEESLLHVSKILKKKYPQIKKISIKIIKPNIMENCRVGAKYAIKY